MRISLTTLVRLTQKDQIRQDNMGGGGVFLGVSYAPTASGWGPSATQFWRFLLFLHTPFDAELPNLT